MARLTLYGLEWAEGWTRPIIELYCWANHDKLPIKEVPRWHHLKHAMMLLDPEMRDGWNDWLEMMCYAYGSYSYIAALGCTISTKTHSFHKFGYYDALSDPFNTIMTCTTTNSAGLEQRMWPVVNNTFNYLKTQGVIDDWRKTVSPVKMITPRPDEKRFGIRAVTIDPRANKEEVVDQLIGVHGKRRLWFVDEATSAPLAIQDAWANASAGTDHRRLVELGNPYDMADALASFCRPIGGWNTVNEDTEMWEFEFYGEKGIGLHFHGAKSPNIKHGKLANGKERWPFLFGHDDLARLEAVKESNPTQYYRMCVGWFAPEGISRRVCSMAAIDRYKCGEHAIFRGGDVRQFLSLDPAFGGDRCMLMRWKTGTDTSTAKRVMDLQEKRAIPINPKLMPGEQIGSAVLTMASKYDIKLIAIDTTTNNSAVAEWLSSNSKLKILWVNFGGSASADRQVSDVDVRMASEAYAGKSSELAFAVANHLEFIRGLDKDTCDELVSRYWEPVGEKPTRQKVESKQIYKDRMKKSPDDADCVALGVEAFRHLGGSSSSRVEAKRDDWKAEVKAKASIYNSEHSYV